MSDSREIFVHTHWNQLHPTIRDSLTKGNMSLDNGRLLASIPTDEQLRFFGAAIILTDGAFKEYFELQGVNISNIQDYLSNFADLFHENIIKLIANGSIPLVNATILSTKLPKEKQILFTNAACNFNPDLLNKSIDEYKKHVNLDKVLKRLTSNFHPEIADLIDQGLIPFNNSIILHKLPKEVQIKYKYQAQTFNAEALNNYIKTGKLTPVNFDEAKKKINPVITPEELAKKLGYPDNYFKHLLKDSKKSNLIDKNILIIAHNDKAYWFLVPLSRLGDIDIDALNGCSLCNNEVPNKIKNNIYNLFGRLGLINYNQEVIDDLKDCLNPIPPFMVDDILHISM